MCSARTCVSVRALVDGIRTQLDEQVVGYVLAAGESTTVAGGAARRAPDTPTRPMTADTVVNTASVGKMFTTITLIKSLDRHAVSLDAPIQPYLPPDWSRGPNVDTITFRDLLTHRSGFRHASARIFTSEAAAQEQIALGVQPGDRAIADYNNINFSIVRDLLPQLDHAPAESSDRLFLEHIRGDVLEPVGAHSAMCAEPAEPMLYYPPPAAPTAPGKIPPTGPSACASGGWFITTTDLLAVLNGLEHGELLTTDQKRQMDQGCLGWDTCTPAGSHWKTGGYGDQTGAFGTYFGTLAGVPLVVVSNSHAPDPLETIVAKALFTATSPPR